MVATQRKRRARFNVDRLLSDMALRGWNNTDLANAADLSAMTVSRFLRGEAQTPKTAERLAQALGYSVKRYFSHIEAVAS